MVWIKNTLLVLASITVTLGALEGVLHLSSIRYAFLPPLEPRGYVRYDSVLGFDIAPDVATTTHQFYDLSYPVWSNELGCFDMPYHGETPFIYMTGDSFTWGWTPFQDKWGTQLQALLGLRTLKCGVNAYGTRHEYLKTERDLVRLSAPPKFVILGYLGGNDADDDAAFPEYVGYDGLRIPTPFRCPDASVRCEVPRPSLSFLGNAKLFLGTHSVLYGVAQRYGNLEGRLRQLLIVLLPDSWLIAHGIIHVPTSVQGSERDIAYAAHLQQMQLFASMVRAHGSRLVVVLIPTKEDARGVTDTNARMRAFLRTEGISTIDLLPAFTSVTTQGGAPLYWHFDGHWNPRGNRLAALVVAHAIADADHVPGVSADIGQLLHDEFGYAYDDANAR
jgi:hypothetical protein